MSSERVTEMPDNVDAAPTPAETSTPARLPGSMFYICDTLGKQLGKIPSEIKFVAPQQVVDGSIADLIDVNTGVALATCRLRFGNVLKLDKTDGMLSVPVIATDVMTDRPGFIIKTTP